MQEKWGKKIRLAKKDCFLIFELTWKGHKPSQAKLKILQLEDRLELITNKYFMYLIHH